MRKETKIVAAQTALQNTITSYIRSRVKESSKVDFLTTDISRFELKNNEYMTSGWSGQKLYRTELTHPQGRGHGYVYNHGDANLSYKRIQRLCQLLQAINHAFAQKQYDTVEDLITAAMTDNAALSAGATKNHLSFDQAKEVHGFWGALFHRTSRQSQAHLALEECLRIIERNRAVLRVDASVAQQSAAQELGGLRPLELSN